MSSTIPNQELNKQSKSVILSSYLKRINCILESTYSQLFLYLIKENSNTTKKTKITKDLRLKQSSPSNWIELYRNLLLKEKQAIPKLAYKYLHHRSRLELKFLFEESKRLNYPYLTYIEIYITKIKHHLIKIKEKQMQEQNEQAVQYNSYGLRKMRTLKTLKLLPDDHSDEDKTKDKKAIVTQQMNKVKKESKQELDEILQSGQLIRSDKYKHVKSKYLVDQYSNPSHYNHLLVTSCIQSPKYKSAPATTTNKYKPIITEAKETENKGHKDEARKTVQTKANKVILTIDDEEETIGNRSERNKMITMFTNGDFYYM